MRTKSLFHFTKCRDVLLLILENGFWPRLCFEDIRWVNGPDFYVLPMVCFCDIPLPKLEAHTSFYGRFGIGMKREWGIKNGLNPLMYISENSILKKSLFKIMANPNPKKRHLKTDSLITLGHTKPLVGRMISEEKLIERNFYEECEWRYIDTSVGGLFREDLDEFNTIESFNEKTRANSLKFEPDDIRYLLVESESDVAVIVDFINTKMGAFPLNKLKLLITKIIVLDDLKSDV